MGRAGGLETPKTAGLRNVQPFQLNVPGVGLDSDPPIKSFNPSEGTGSIHMGEGGFGK